MQSIDPLPTPGAQLNQLVGLPAWGAGIAASMITIQFGSKTSRINRRGAKSEVGEFALHIQCPWRISRNDEILVGIDDYYYSEDEGAALQEISQTFGDIFGDDLLVEEIKTQSISGFTICLSTKILIAAFPTAGITGRESEAWRLFSPMKNEDHFVMMSDGLLE